MIGAIFNMMKQFNHIGSLRHIANYLIGEEFSTCLEWLKVDTETEKDEAHDELYKWLEKTFNGEAYRDADGIISRCWQAYEQAAFEKGMKYGANIMIGLMQNPVIRE